MTLSPQVSRRDFLRTTAVVALAPWELPRPGSADSAGFIDAHVHVWDRDTARYPRAAEFKGAKIASPASFPPEEILGQCRPQGVSWIVLIQMSFYGYDNRYLLDAIAARPQTFRGVAVVDETSPTLKEELKNLAAHGVRGFRLMADRTSVEGWADSPAMNALWSQATDAELALCPLADPDALPALGRMCSRHPRAKVVIDHLARIGLDGEIRQDDIAHLCHLADFEHTYVKTSAFYALGAKQPPYTDLAPLIHRLRDVYGASRLMWGSDCPFQVQLGRTYADSIALIRDRLPFLSAEDKAWMLRKTAEKVFFA